MNSLPHNNDNPEVFPLSRTPSSTIATLLVVAILAGTFPAPTHANDNIVVDALWEARQDSNVIDSFLTLEESMEKWKEEREERALEEMQTSPDVELISVSENSSEEEQIRLDEKRRAAAKHLTPIARSLLGITDAPKVHLLSEHLYPKEGEEWSIRFRTEGTGTLIIRPTDQSTVEEDEYIGLWCGEEFIEAEIDQGDVIRVNDWKCDDIATVSHLTIKEGAHTLSITLDETSQIARNGPNTYKVMGYFHDPVTTSTFGGNASINVRQPDPAPGDLMVASIAIRPSTDIVTTPSGWTSLGSQDGTDGAGEAADTGSVRIYTMYKVATGSEGTANQTFAESGTPSVWGVKIFKFRSASGTYDIATSSLQKNGDTTAFGGTFSNANINLQSGDALLMAAASNGNLTTGYAGWAITASGASFGTVSEILDTNSTTGNDIRYAAAKTYVTGGTAHADASVTITATNASSGASTLVRIRQGDGPNRTDSFLRGCGLGAAGSTSVAPAYPENEPGDLLLLLVGVRNSTVNPTTPTNWNSLGSYTGGAGVFGVDAGGAKVQGFSRVVTGTAPLTGTQSVTLTSGNTALGYICAVHRDGAYSWSIDTDGGADDVVNTTWSVTGSGIDLSDSDGGDVILMGNAINTDTAITWTNHNLTASGITFDYINDVSQRQTSGTGNDMQFNMSHGEVATGSATNVAPTHTVTASTSAGSYPTGATIIIAARGNYTPYDGRRLKLISTTLKVNEGGRVKVYQQ